MQNACTRGELTSVALVEGYLRRIGEVDSSGPKLRSLIELNPDAVAIAEALDNERAQGRVRGPLHGVPVVIKDSIDTADSMSTTGGSLALEGNIAPRDAHIVTRLRDAGAVIVGKTNMSEWGYMRSIRPCSGWSSRGGQVRNPYVLDRSPLGSSSGSAVAVAANLCLAAVGAEVDGSIVRPASSNSIVGLKPTVGLVSRSGIIGVAPSQDTAGPMARTVADVAALLTVLSGFDERDPIARDGAARGVIDYRQFLDESALRGARIGVARECFGRHEGTDGLIDSAIAQLEELGAQIVDPVQASSLPFFGHGTRTVPLRRESESEFLPGQPSPGSGALLDELIAFNADNAAATMPFFGQEFFEQARRKGDMSDPECRRIIAELRRLSRTDGIDKALRDFRSMRSSLPRRARRPS